MISLLNTVLAYLIRFLHIALILFMCLVPFVSSDPVLMATHMTASFGMMFHWLLNSDVCFLTEVESYLRGIPHKTSFFYHLVSPVYVIPDQKLKQLVWVITAILTSISTYKFIKHRKEFVYMLKLVLFPEKTTQKQEDD